MLANAFIGWAEKPTEDELEAELGPAAKARWDELIADLTSEHEISIHEWNSYSRKAGWALRIKRGKRTILYLSPSRNAFMASFALGDKAVRAALQCGIPARVIQIIKEAKRYAEGTGVRLEVSGPEDVVAVRKLAGIKIEN